MYEEASQVANDAVSGIRTVASFCAEPKVMDMYQKKCQGPEEKGVRLGLISGAGFGFSFFALYCTNAFCFYIGSILVKHGKANFQEVFKVWLHLDWEIHLMLLFDVVLNMLVLCRFSLP